MMTTNYDKQHIDDILTQAIVSFQANVGLEDIVLRWGWTQDGKALTVLVCKKLYVPEYTVIDQSENDE